MQSVFSHFPAVACNTDIESPTTELEDFEREVMSQLMAEGRRRMVEYLEGLSPQEPFRDEAGFWKISKRSRLLVLTKFGPVQVKRPLFRCVRNGPLRCMVKERAGLIKDLWTPCAAKLATMALAEMPATRAEDFLKEAGVVHASKSSIQRLVHDLSTKWEEDRLVHEQAVQQSLRIPYTAASVAVSLDGVMLQMLDSDKALKKARTRAQGKADKGPSGFREASVSAISFFDDEGRRLTTWRYGRMPEDNKVTTKEWMRQRLDHIRASGLSMLVVAIADGAANNWTFLEELKADYEVVDFYHTAEHLHQHVSKANGASTVETQNLLKEMRRTLLEEENGGHAVFRQLEELRTKAGTTPPSLTKKRGRRQPTYFDRHKDRMNYAELKAKNLPIGSGVTESTCKLLVCDRMRCTGMRWSDAGGQAVLTFRTHVINGTFDAAWESLTRTTRAAA